jgi:hypothetical protein
MILLLRLMFILSDMLTLFGKGGWRGRVRMVVGFTSTCAISAYHHKLWINLHFVNSAGLQQNAPFCILLKKFIFSWFYHTIFKNLTTQILYPKCSRMHHFASFWKKRLPYHKMVHSVAVLENSQNANVFPFRECLMKWNSSVHAVLNTLS